MDICRSYETCFQWSWSCSCDMNFWYSWFLALYLILFIFKCNYIHALRVFCCNISDAMLNKSHDFLLWFVFMKELIHIQSSTNRVNITWNNIIIAFNMVQTLYAVHYRCDIELLTSVMSFRTWCNICFHRLQDGSSIHLSYQAMVSLI